MLKSFNDLKVRQRFHLRGNPDSTTLGWGNPTKLPDFTDQVLVEVAEINASDSPPHSPVSNLAARVELNILTEPYRSKYRTYSLAKGTVNAFCPYWPLVNKERCKLCNLRNI